MRPSAANDVAGGGGGGGAEGGMDADGDVDVDAASELMKIGSLSSRRLLGRASVILRRVPMKPAVCCVGWVAVRAKTVQTAMPPTGPWRSPQLARRQDEHLRCRKLRDK